MNFNDIKNFDFNIMDYINLNIVACGMNYLLIFLLLLVVTSSILVYAIILIEKQIKKGDKKWI